MQSVRDKEPTRSSELPFALAEPPRLFLRPFLPTLIMQKEKRHSFEYRFIGFRQLPILPGRFQPSTFSVWRLNFCVRYGNRWNPPAIVTGNCYSILFPSATSKPHRTDLKSSNNYFFFRPSLSLRFPSAFRSDPADQALDLLVSTSSMCYHTSTDDLSTLSSSRGLTYL